MLYWVDAPHGIVPHLLLDKYWCHYQGSVDKAIEDLGVEWDIIQGGCTGLIQPIDVAIGKPFKNQMRYRWEEWKYEDNAAVATSCVATSEARRFIAIWALQLWTRIPKDIVYNSWRHKPFSYFPEEKTVPTTFDNKEEEMGSSDKEENGDEDTADEEDIEQQEAI